MAASWAPKFKRVHVIGIWTRGPLTLMASYQPMDYEQRDASGSPLMCLSKCGCNPQFQGQRAVAQEACKNATGLNLSHVAAVSVGAMQLFLIPSLPDVDWQRAHLALGITYLASARGCGFQKYSHSRSAERMRAMCFFGLHSVLRGEACLPKQTPRIALIGN